MRKSYIYYNRCNDVARTSLSVGAGIAFASHGYRRRFPHPA